MPRVIRIFTNTTISPSLLSRQCPNHYAFRAGRNLPDKEFRYLRTVIVTAAVYWGFGSKLSPFPLTFQHRAGVSPYTSPCGLAETYVFGKQLLGPILCGHVAMAPLLPKLRGYFAEFLNKSFLVRLRILSLPTCVGFSTGTVDLDRGFSWQFRVSHFVTKFHSPSRLGLLSGGFACLTSCSLGRAQPTARLTYLPASPLFSNDLGWHWILNQLSINYALEPRLRSRLTLGGLAFPRKL